MAQEGPGADCGSDARPFLPLGRVVRIPFSDLGRLLDAFDCRTEAKEATID